MKQGWEKRRIGDICIVIAGQSPEGKYYNTEGKGLPFYQGKKEFGTKYLGEPTTWTTETTKTANDGDILMSVRAPVGPVNFATNEICIGRGLAAIRALKNINKEYLFNFLIKHESEIVGNTGAVFNSINKAQIEAIEISLPPLSEQKRIVAILDEAFSAIATAKANAEKNLKNAKELFESYLQSVFENKGDGWKEKTLEDLFQIGSSKRIMEKDWTVEGVPFYGGKEIVKLSKFGYVVSNSYISEEKFNEYASKYDMPQHGDILITARGTIGIGYIVKEGDKFYYKDGNIISMRATTPTNPKFILYALKSKTILDQLKKLTGATVSHLPIEKAKQLVLMMPNFDNQNIVAAKIEEVEAETRKLETIYLQKMSGLEELKKSILQIAFSGKLNLDKVAV